MRPLSLVIEGFTCFKDKQPSINFSALDLFAIAGPTGAGKSSILDAIVFALYGKVPRMGGRGLAELISLGRDRMAVVLDFSVGAQSYRVARRVRRRGAAEVQLEQLVNGSERPVAEGVREVEERIQQLLGLRYEAFTQAVVLPQGEFQRFLKSQPRDRREILRDLLRLQVYERMRQLARQEQDQLWGRMQNLQERLQQEYAGVTQQALEQERGHLRQLTARNKQAASDLRKQEADLASLRVRFEKSCELTAKHVAMEQLAAQEKEMCARSEKIAAAIRASTVVPVVETAATREKVAEEEAQRATDTVVLREAAQKIYAAANTHLEKCQEAALRIALLRQRTAMLDELKGVFEARSSASNRKRDAERQKKKIEGEQRELEQGAEAAATRAREADGTFEKAQATLARVPFDKVLGLRVDAVREKATKLAALREALNSDRAEADRLVREAERQQMAASGARTRAEQSTSALLLAEQEWHTADAALREAERRNAGLILREGLAVGEECPVCEQPVARLPRKHKAVEIESLRAKCEQAYTALEHAKAAAQSGQTSAVQATSAATEGKKNADTAAKKIAAGAEQFQKLENELTERVGNDVRGEKDKTIEERVLATAKKLAEAREHFETATQTHRAAELAQQRAQHEHAQLEANLKATKERLADTVKQIQQTDKEIVTLTEQIEKVTKDPDPLAERKRLTAEIEDLEKALKAAQADESKARTQLAAAEQSEQETQRVAAAAQQEADKARKRAHESALEAGFVDEIVAVKAALTPVQRQRLEAEVDHYQRERHSVEQRVKELEGELASDMVSAEAFEEAAQRVVEVRKDYEGAIREEAGLKKTVEDLQQRLKTAERLSGELQTVTAGHQVYKQLADDLRSERFQAYLLEEAFHELVRGASVRLMELSSRYTFDYRDDAFYVLDHDNAQEQRSTDTLSGGETFLASLALALELSQQVQRAAGAVNLDSLFIDEGFGTLDAETLDTVASAIESLRVGGRMVGIITHIPELTMRLPERIVVEKRSDGSRVHSEAD